MKIRLTAPKWLKKRREMRAKREAKMLDVIDETYYGKDKHWSEKIGDWYDVSNVSLGNIISGFVVLMVGFTLVGPISDAVTAAASSSTTQNVTVENMTQLMEDIALPGVLSNKFFLFMMLVVGPFLMWRAMGFTRNGGMY